MQMCDRSQLVRAGRIADPSLHRVGGHPSQVREEPGGGGEERGGAYQRADQTDRGMMERQFNCMPAEHHILFTLITAMGTTCETCTKTDHVNDLRNTSLDSDPNIASSSKAAPLYHSPHSGAPAFPKTITSTSMTPEACIISLQQFSPSPIGALTPTSSSRSSQSNKKMEPFMRVVGGDP